MKNKRGKFIAFLLLTGILGGGYWHGFIYYPAKYPELAAATQTFDLMAVLIGSLLGAVCVFIVVALLALGE